MSRIFLANIWQTGVWSTWMTLYQVIAICDSGYNFLHEDLPSDAIKGPDYVNDDNDPTDDHSHGKYSIYLLVLSH